MKYIKVKEYRINLEKLFYYRATDTFGFVIYFYSESGAQEIKFDSKFERDEIMEKLDKITLLNETIL